MKSKAMSGKKRGLLIAAAAVLLVLIVIADILLCRLIVLKRNASQLKSETKSMAQSLMALDTESAQEHFANMQTLSAALREETAEPTVRFAGMLAHREYTAGLQLLDVLDEASSELIGPLLDLMEECPPDGLRKILGAADRYAAFAEEALPKAKALMDTAAQIEPGLLDRKGKLKAAIDLGDSLLDLIDDDAMELLGKVTEHLNDYPLSEIRTEDGIRVSSMIAYLDLMTEIAPQCREYLDKAMALCEDSALQDSSISGKLGKAGQYLALYENNQPMLELIRMFIGDGSDRYYLIPALNNSEPRAAGGFPGSMGSVEIRDGFLNIGSFLPVREMVTSNDASGSTTEAERYLFRSPLATGFLSWDACCNPDYPWAARVWAASHEAMSGHHVDGVISINPTIVQKLLSLTGPVTLSNGMELDGSNATRMLEYEVYFTYFGTDSASGGNTEADSLFSETAATVIQKLTSSLSFRTLPAFCDTVTEALNDHTIQIWMEDEEEEAFITETGWSGALDSTPGCAEAGIYFNYTNAGKMGWFVDMDTTLSEPELTETGDTVYTITVTLNNLITEEEIAQGTSYILGENGGNGSISCELFLFAPKDGHIQALSASGVGRTETDTYHGLECSVVRSIYLKPGEPQTLSYQVVLPADETLILRTTPLLQDTQQ